MEAVRFKDKYNEFKEWEIIKLNGGYYLKQYIKGRQFGRGLRTTKRFLENTFEIRISYSENDGLKILNL